MLAIVIPVYKVKFLAKTLESLCSQTNRDFKVYVGDDNSPDDIEACINLFKDKLPLTYKKFEDNLGHISLTKQWERCIGLIKDEKWIWMLPDDDTASMDCVESFYKGLNAIAVKQFLFRFQTDHIDEKDIKLYETNLCPPSESNVDFVIGKLQFKRNSSLAEYIFSKDMFEKCGGFIDLPLAWGSDDLLWVKLSQENDIVTLPFGKVSLRQSNLNISNNTFYTKEKFEAKYKYLLLLLSDNEFIKKLKKRYSIIEFKKIITEHLFFEYKSHTIKFSIKNIMQYALLNNRVIGGGIFKNIYRLINYKFSNGRL